MLVLLAPMAVGAEFSHGPYAGAPSRDAVVISWAAAPLLPARIEYSPRSTFELTGTMHSSILVPAAQDGDETPTSHVRLEALDRSTDYVYRVVLIDEDQETVSPMGSFSTEPAADQPISFVVLADTQQQSEAVNRLELVGDAIAADPFPMDFILHAGDLVEEPLQSYWDHWFASFAGMLLRAPLIPVLGNHEENHRSYYEAFSLPPGDGEDGKRWWALHWGDAVVVGLDTNVRKASDYIAQQRWASTHLAGPEPHKFVIFHHPVFVSDAARSTGSSLEQTYHPIFVETGVDVVFSGHVHHYERIVRDGVTYLVVGGGGATPRSMGLDRVQGSVVSVEGYFFYARVRATSGRIDVETVSVAELFPNGTVARTEQLLDAFTLSDGLPEENAVFALEEKAASEERVALEENVAFSVWAVVAIAVGVVLGIWALLRAGSA